jgi:FG-GAP repeat
MHRRPTRFLAASLAAGLCLSGSVAHAGPAGGHFREPVTVLSHVTIPAGRVYFGWALSELGDVNGDGVADFISGAPLLRGQRGGAFVYSGATSKRLFRFLGRPGDQAGWAIADAGDVNGDGVHDVLVGAPGASGPGRASVYSGVNGERLLHVAAHAEGDRFGYAVAGVGDLNHDGHDDFMVGAPGDDHAGTDAGQVTVFSGSDGHRMLVLRGSSGDHFGVGTDGTADMNGDGVGDLVAGARDAGPGHRGQVSVFSGKTGARLWVTDAASTGVDFGTFFVAGVGDLDRDGTPDVYAADYSDKTHGGNTGRGYVLSGVDGTPIREMVGSGRGQGLGPGREAGDVDGDGVEDLIVGSYLSNDGAPRAGKVQIFSGATGEVLRTLTGTDQYDNVGFDAVSLGDVNGDGIPDELISAANRNDVYVVAGIRP